jgi:hypothetical protein
MIGLFQSHYGLGLAVDTALRKLLILRIGWV